MPKRIAITIGQHHFDAELNDTRTATNLYEALPLGATLSRWGDEVYFMTEIEPGEGDSMREEMGVGELAFWPPGRAFCIFWGPTPSSQAGEPRAAGPVVPIGRLLSDPSPLNETAAGQTIRIDPVGDE
jgi:hypothetical protein